jgi:glycogen debranching enzyme
MKLKFEQHNLEELKSYEWLETNGLGAWAMGTLSGINTRKYHSWLTASYNPPTDRYVLIPKLI